MGLFLYFIDGIDTTISHAELCALGLGYALDEQGLTTPQSNSGPSGKAGLVCGRDGGERRVAYYADKEGPQGQTWRRIPDAVLRATADKPAECNGVWLGFYNDDPPAMEDLARSEMIAGHAVELLDGKRWTVPMALGPVDDQPGIYKVLLDRRLTLDDAGEWSTEGVQARQAALWDVAWEWFSLRMGTKFEGTTQFVNFSDEICKAAEVLSYNYYIGQCEADVLGLLDTKNIIKILDACCDMPGWLALEKKRADAGVSSEDGSSEDGPATDPA